MKKKKDKKTMLVAVIVLSLLLSGALTYVLLDVVGLINTRNDREQAIYNQGASYGYEAAVSELYGLLGDCKPVPVMYNNETRQIIDIACLQQ